MSTGCTKTKSWMKRSIGNPKHYPYAPILRPLPHRVERVTFVRHAVKRFYLTLARVELVKPREIITKMSRKLFFLLSPSAVLFYFLFTVRVPHKKTINLLFTDHQEIVSRRGLFTTHVRLVAGKGRGGGACGARWLMHSLRLPRRKMSKWYILSFTELSITLQGNLQQLLQFSSQWIIDAK